MRRIIAHLIRGEAKNKHEALTKDLVEKFDVFPIHNRIPPHLTLKRWFELDEKSMKELHSTLDEFVSLQKQSDYRLHGFGRFGEDVIYIDVVPSVKMSQTTRELMKVLHNVEGMTFDKFDDIEDDFHATLVMKALKPFDFDQVWNYVTKQEEIDLNMKFDNIAILKKETDVWVVERIWEIPV